MNYQDDFGQWVIDGHTVVGPATEAEAIALLAEMNDPNRIIREQNPRIVEIKSLLAEIDLKTIRALRSNESSKIQEYEAQAVALRSELSELPEMIEHQPNQN